VRLCALKEEKLRRNRDRDKSRVVKEKQRMKMSGVTTIEVTTEDFACKNATERRYCARLGVLGELRSDSGCLSSACASGRAQAAYGHWTLEVGAAERRKISSIGK